jgi:predicted nuclease with TOPRIM domain
MSLATAPSIAQEIKRIRKELKRLGDRAKELREQKQKSEERLYNIMKRNDLKDVEGIKRSTIAPKVRTKRKKESDKKRDAVNLFNEVGITDTEWFWNRLKETQKYVPPEIHIY